MVMSPIATRRAWQGLVRARHRTSEGSIASFVHDRGRVGVLVEVNCETDLVARSDAFRTLVRQLSEHIAAAAPLAVSRAALGPSVVERQRELLDDAALEAWFRAVVLLEQPWIRERRITVGDLLTQTSALTGENIQVLRFARFHMGVA